MAKDKDRNGLLDKFMTKEAATAGFARVAWILVGMGLVVGFLFICIVGIYFTTGFAAIMPLGGIINKTHGLGTHDDIGKHSYTGEKDRNVVAQGDFYALAYAYFYKTVTFYKDLTITTANLDIHNGSIRVHAGDILLGSGNVSLADGQITSNCNNEMELRNTTGAGIEIGDWVGVVDNGLVQKGFAQVGSYQVANDIANADADYFNILTSACKLYTGSDPENSQYKTVEAYFDADNLLTFNVTYFSNVTGVPVTYSGTYQPNPTAYDVPSFRQVQLACSLDDANSFAFVYLAPDAQTITGGYLRVSDYSPLTFTVPVGGFNDFATSSDFCLGAFDYYTSNTFWVSYTTSATSVIRVLSANTATLAITAGSTAVVNANLAGTCASIRGATMSSQTKVALAYASWPSPASEELQVVSVSISGTTCTVNTAYIIYTPTEDSAIIEFEIRSLGANDRFWLGWTDVSSDVYGQMTTGIISSTNVVTFTTPFDNFLSYARRESILFTSAAVAPHGTANAEQSVILCYHYEPSDITMIAFGCRKLEYHNGVLTSNGTFATIGNFDAAAPVVVTVGSDFFAAFYVRNGPAITSNSLDVSVGVWNSAGVINYVLEDSLRPWGLARGQSTENGYAIIVQTSGCYTNSTIYNWEVTGLPLYICGPGNLSADPSCGTSLKNFVPVPAAWATGPYSIKFVPPPSVDPVRIAPSN